jgi:hypothetical protein
MTPDQFQDEDAAAIRQYFEKLAAQDELANELRASPLPSPELIWWRARLAEKRRLSQRSVVAIDTVAAFSIGIAAAFVAIITLLWAPRLFGDLPLPLPWTVALFVIFGCVTGGVLLAWSRQRYPLHH